MNNSKLSKVLTLIALVIALIGAYFYIRVLLAGDDAFKEESAEALALQNSIISPFVWFTVVVLIITVVASLVSSVVSLVKKPEQLKKTLLSIVVLGVVLVIAYFLHDAAEVIGADGKILEGGEEGSTANVWSSTGIWYSVILGGVGLVLFLVDMVKGLVKS